MELDVRAGKKERMWHNLDTSPLAVVRSRCLARGREGQRDADFQLRKGNDFVAACLCPMLMCLSHKFRTLRN